jgi:hypothetical protein
VADNSALHRQLDRSWQDRDRAPLFETLVRACLVIVDQELLDHCLQVASAEDEQVVEQLPAGGKDEPLRDRVRPRCPVRQPQDFHALGAEDRSKAAVNLSTPGPPDRVDGGMVTPHPRRLAAYARDLDLYFKSDGRERRRIINARFGTVRSRVQIPPPRPPSRIRDCLLFLYEWPGCYSQHRRKRYSRRSPLEFARVQVAADGPTSGQRALRQTVRCGESKRHGGPIRPTTGRPRHRTVRVIPRIRIVCAADGDPSLLGNSCL